VSAPSVGGFARKHGAVGGFSFRRSFFSVNDQRMLAAASFCASQRPRDQRVCHAGNDLLAPDVTAHALANAKAGRSVSAEKAEAFSVAHCRDTLTAIKS
jgi:hypothetical protein